MYNPTFHKHRRFQTIFLQIMTPTIPRGFLSYSKLAVENKVHY